MIRIFALTSIILFFLTSCRDSENRRYKKEKNSSPTEGYYYNSSSKNTLNDNISGNPYINNDDDISNMSPTEYEIYQEAQYSTCAEKERIARDSDDMF